MVSTLSGWALGFLLGMRHSLEPDHLAAVSMLVAEHPRPRAAAMFGAFWGMGHTAALVLLGGSLLALRSRVPTGVAEAFELAVAAMLVVLGARGVRVAVVAGRGGARRPHAHGDLRHEHAGAPDHVHVGALALARRPLIVGIVHGLAGSGSLTALALAGMPSLGAGVLYLAMFGLGSMAGMALVAGVAGSQLARVAGRPRAHAAVVACASFVSIGLGIAWAVRVLQ